jgi:hypothetical protein
MPYIAAGIKLYKGKLFWVALLCCFYAQHDDLSKLSNFKVKPEDFPRLSNFKINYSDSVPGDFSFKNIKHYPAYIFKKETGQLYLDVLVPEEIQHMKDSNGEVIHDSLPRYYSLLDTNQIPWSSNSDSWTIGWIDGLHDLVYEKIGDTIKFSNICYGGIYSSFNFIIIGDSIASFIRWTPIMLVEDNTKTNFEATAITAYLDKQLIKKGIVKLNIKADYNDGEKRDAKNPRPKMYFYGCIYFDLSKKYNYWGYRGW